MVNLQEHRPMEFEDVDATDEELVERYRRLFEMKQVELKCGLINERAIDFVNFLRPRSFEERKILREERELEQKIRAELEYREGLIWTKKRRGLSTEKEKVMEHRAIMTERIAEQMRKGKRLTKAQ
jgi:hypothetical protein